MPLTLAESNQLITSVVAGKGSAASIISDGTVAPPSNRIAPTGRRAGLAALSGSSIIEIRPHS